MLELSAISCHTNTELLEKQAREFSPRFAAVSGLDRVQQDIFGGTKTGCGEEALLEACEGADIVVLAIVGMAALRPFEFCLKNDIPVALANKESLVCGGRLIRDIMDRRGSQVLPVDSETFAISECISRRKRAEIRSVLLTASGGPFRTASEEVIRNATPEMALAHPNWAMGKKISVDCATMINKGLEIMDRVGGGDSFASGLVYGLMTTENAELAVNYGAAHGALAMTTPGDTTMASKKEVEAIMGGAGARVQR